MSMEFIAYETNGNVGIITLNSPKTLNSVNEKMLAELARQVSEYNKSDKIKVIILKGIEKSFAAGMDIKELAGNMASARTIIKNMQDNFAVIQNSEKPLIAVVSGFALGIGCEIALCCDIILASDNARFGLPELSIGLLPCFGGCGLLTNRIGKSKAMDMILTGRALSAEEAERSGLISRIVTESSLAEEYMKIAQRIASLPQNTVSIAKRLIAGVSEKQNPMIEKIASLNQVESGEFRQALTNFANKSPSNTEKQ